MPVVWSGPGKARLRRASADEQSGDEAAVPRPVWRAVALRLDERAVPRATGGLAVGAADDVEEMRADRVADSVMRRLARGADAGGTEPVGGVAAPALAALHRIAAPADSAVVGRAGGPLGTDLSGEIASRLGGGSAIPAPLRRSMEGAFGRDLGAVRLHSDDHAAVLSRKVAARAFTVGNDVFFGAGEYRPDTVDGQRTLAHELAHTGEVGAQIGRAHAPTEEGPVRRQLRPAEIHRIFGRDKKLKVGKPKNARAMSKEDKKGVPDAKSLETFKKDTPNADSWVPDTSANPELTTEVSALRVITTGTDLWEVDSKTGEFGSSITAANNYTVPASHVHPFGEGTVVVLIGETWWAVRASEVKSAGHQQEDSEVFPVGDDGKMRLPRPEDVVQGSLGDCYLEAAVAGLAKTSPQTIVDMIKDFGPTVTVRLFDVDRTDPSKPVFTPCFVRVEKSRVRSGGKLQYDRGALWVGLIEKAYIAGKFGGSEEITAANRGKTTASAAGIDGGYLDFATEVLTGKKTRYVFVQQSGAKRGAQTTGLPWTRREMKAYQAVAMQPNLSYDGLVSMTALKDRDLVDAWMAWVISGGEKLVKDLFASIQAKPDTYTRGSLRLEDFELLFADNLLPGPVSAPMLDYLGNYFPGKRGTGKYSKEQMRTWRRIRKALAAGHVVTAGTNGEVGRSNSGVGHSGGEAMSRGIVGGHAYTVMDTRVDDAGRRFVQMRNPWGHYSRDYDFTKTKATGGQVSAVEGGDGMTWFELDDVTKRFEGMAMHV